MVIDTLKHSVLGKFNDVRPGIYREYMKVSRLLDVQEGHTHLHLSPISP